ncbi:uncharacterized protein [Montipora foliosa]|uniref:uncharacterized protein n=1 Tax=Montipora foliosa TaxID=591990 RepID=UPI0035F12E90
MPPLRRRSRVQDTNVGTEAALLNGYSVQQLRNLCRQKKIASTGNKATLLNRLRGSVPVLPQDHVVNTNANDSTFSEGQLNTIRQLVQESVAAASREIANEAALAAVQVLQPSSSQTASNSNCVTPAIETLTPQQTASPLDICQHAAPFQDIPAQYVKDIQSGEFFELSKLLPKNLSEFNDEDNLVLTLDNSVVRVSKKANTSTSITEIEQWTTAFTTYMSVFTHKFPQRSQELLQYLSLIRYAARVHRGLGWAIYDYKFRQQAGQNKTRVWSEIDQQLWLKIFTVAPSVLKEEYPLFSNGPQTSSVSTGGERRGTCHNFNRLGWCHRSPCSFKHVCNKCAGAHPGHNCPKFPGTPREARDRDRDNTRGGDKGTLNPKSSRRK